MPLYVSISRATWSHYENNKSQPPIKGLIEIAAFFEVSLDDLITKDLVAADPEGFKYLQRTRSYKNYQSYPTSQLKRNIEDYENAYQLLQLRVTVLEQKVEMLGRDCSGHSSNEAS